MSDTIDIEMPDNSGNPPPINPEGQQTPFFQRTPFRSTVFAALLLALGWVAVWLFIFFASTLLLGLQTGIIAFIVTFWLSILAESFIRFMENTTYIARYSKPFEDNPVGDNQDFNGSKASLLFFIGMGVLLFAGYIWHLAGGGITSFTPPPASVKYQGYILEDRAGLILRNDECEMYPTGSHLIVTDEGVKVVSLTEDGQHVAAVKKKCPDDYAISPSERLSISGMDDPNRGFQSLKRMWTEWASILRSWPFLLTFGFGIFMRILIYKRKHIEDDTA